MTLEHWSFVGTVVASILAIGSLIYAHLAWRHSKKANDIAIKIHTSEIIAPYCKYAWNLQWKLENKPLSSENIDTYIKETEEAMVAITPFDIETAHYVYHIHHMLTALKTIPNMNDRIPLMKLIVDTINVSIK